jgi:hypothetical protein
MMLEKEWLCSLFEIVSWSGYAPLSTSYSKGAKHVVITKGRSSRNNFKCAWEGNELELLAPIASNKNERESNKNLKAMIGVIIAQLPK